MHASYCVWQVSLHERAASVNCSGRTPIWCDRQNSHIGDGFRHRLRHRADGGDDADVTAVTAETDGETDAAGTIVSETVGAVAWLAHAVTNANANANGTTRAIPKLRGTSPILPLE